MLTVKVTCSPLSKSADFGWIAVNNLFCEVNTKNVNFDESIGVNQKGLHFCCRGNFPESVYVSGYIKY